MSHHDEMGKSLTQNAHDEKGWRKKLAAADGTSARELAEKNLNRLHAERHTLLHRQTSFEARKQYIMNRAVKDGIVTDRLRDGVCQELVTEGWLVPAEANIRRSNRVGYPTFLPTDRALETLLIPDEEPQETDQDQVPAS